MLYFIIVDASHIWGLLHVVKVDLQVTFSLERVGSLLAYTESGVSGASEILEHIRRGIWGGQIVVEPHALMALMAWDSTHRGSLHTRDDRSRAATQCGVI